MTLQDLVTEHSPEPEETESFQALDPLMVAVVKPRVRNEDVLDLCRSARQNLPKDPQRAPYITAQLFAYLERGRRTSSRHLHQPSRVITAFSLAAKYALDENSDHLDDLLEIIDKIEEAFSERQFADEQARCLGNTLSQIDFLRDFFGEDLTEELAFACEVTKATAKRWSQGGSPNWWSQRKILFVARIFYVTRHCAGMSESEAVDWYRGSFRGGESPREMVSKSSLVSNKTREALKEINFRGPDL